MRNRRLSLDRRAQLEQDLRELCCWHEWSEPPNLAAADVLQGAADALQTGLISLEAAELIRAVWSRHAGIETRAGNGPTLIAVATNEAGVQRGVIEHMQSMIAQQTSTAKRLHLMKLLREQARLFGDGVKCD